MATTETHFESNALSVLKRLLTWKSDGKRTAIAVVIRTEGGGVRAPGAMMGVSETGDWTGYLSGGCIDADIIQQALTCLSDLKTQCLTYGVGSPFRDLPLPCGGAITVLIQPVEDTTSFERAISSLENRRQSALSFSDPDGSEYKFTYTPPLRIRIAGRGADCLALASLATVNGTDVHLQLTDAADSERIGEKPGLQVDLLKTPGTLPDLKDDPWTAFVLMFHDRDWEVPLLMQALTGEAYYIGAVGSPRTQAKRLLELTESGATHSDLARVKGPVGIVPSLRDAPSLATSTLAEIVRDYENLAQNGLNRSGALLLAAGQGKRFEGEDKLLAKVDGSPVLKRTLDQMSSLRFKSRLAVTSLDASGRQAVLASAGWPVIENANAATGISTSLKLGVQALSANRELDSVLVVLGDMPFVSDAHIRNLYESLTPGTLAVFSESKGTLTPPAVFSREAFVTLLASSGDKGAAALFRNLNNVKSIPIANAEALDIDTRQDLSRVEETLNG